MDETRDGIAERYGEACGLLNAKFRELLGALAAIADREFPGKVAGATLRDGAVSIDFVDGFRPEPGDGRLAVLAAGSRDVERAVALSAVHGVDREMVVRLGAGESGPRKATTLH